MRARFKRFCRLFTTLIVFLIPFITFSQSLIQASGDTLLTIDENKILWDISQNRMGFIDSDGRVMNSQNIHTGKINVNNGIVFNASEDTVAFFNGTGLYNYDSVLIATVNNQSVYDHENNLIASFSDMVAIQALFLIFFYY